MTTLFICCLLIAAVFASLWWQQRGRIRIERAAAEEQKQKETGFLRRMQRRAELLHRLVDGIDDGLFIIGGDMRVIFINLGAKYFFPPVTEPVGRKLIECLPDRRIVDLAEQ